MHKLGATRLDIFLLLERLLLELSVNRSESGAEQGFAVLASAAPELKNNGFGFGKRQISDRLEDLDDGAQKQQGQKTRG